MMPDQPETFNMNFDADLRDYILAQLKAGISLARPDLQDSQTDTLTATETGKLFDWFYFFRRRFPIGRRAVLYSREIKQNPLYEKYRKNVNKIAAALETGKTISEYLPDNAHDLRCCDAFNKKSDHMLINWGISHLHLFTHAERANLEQAKQNDDKYLLYIFATFDKVFFIDIQDHKSLTNTELLNIIRTNLQGPALIGYMDSETPVTPNESMTRKEIKELRKLNVCFVLPINQRGDKYMSGMNRLLSYRGYAELHDNIRVLEQWFNDNYPSLITDLKRSLGDQCPQDAIDLHMGFDAPSDRRLHFQRVYVYIKVNDPKIPFLFKDKCPAIAVINNILEQNGML